MKNLASVAAVILVVFILFGGLALFDSQSMSNVKTKQLSELKQLSEQELLLLEDKARVLAEQIGYLTPITLKKRKDLDKIYLDEEFYKKYSSSAFVIVYRERAFLVSVGHVFSNRAPAEAIFFYVNEKEEPLDRELKISEVLDLAASDITALYPRAQWAAILKVETDDLVKEQTPLILICNKNSFAQPVRVGFFEELDAGYSNSAFSRTYLKINFPGIGVENGCSGSPVIDFQGFVRGILVRSASSGQLASAIPASVVVSFLDSKFFDIKP